MDGAARAILTLNAGSSSIKFALFRIAGNPELTVGGSIEGIGTKPHWIARDAAGATLVERRWDDGAARDHEAFLADLLDWLERHLGGDRLIGVGHRIVHGGANFCEPVLIDPAVLDALDALAPLAPLHQPHNLAAVRAVAALRPDLAQVACFDTGFHHSQPSVATRLALPRALEREGIRRYGFHGLSYEHIARRLAEIDPPLAAGRVIVAHLGNGASLCALRAGQSIDTTMGFTTLEGLVMGTRCGTLDPGVLLYLLQHKRMTPTAIEHLLYQEAGLLGVSGLSSDMRVLLESADPQAREAIDLFVYRIVREAGGMLGALQGIDGIVFTAGIGENAPEIRARACRDLAWLGVAIDDAANARHAPLISAPHSRVVVRVIAADEERMIAIHTRDLLEGVVL